METVLGLPVSVLNLSGDLLEKILVLVHGNIVHDRPVEDAVHARVAEDAQLVLVGDLLVDEEGGAVGEK